MPDRTDAKIRAFVVELLDEPLVPPPFPPPAVAPQLRTQPATMRRGWLVAAGSFAVALVLGLLLFLPFAEDDQPVASEPAVVANLTAAINAGDLEQALAWFSEDAVCVAPTLPTCSDLLGFFVAADSTVVLADCAVNIEPYFQCSGYLHTSIHDVLGITQQELIENPNFPPAFIIEHGRVKQLNFSSPFTGRIERDAELWRFFVDLELEFVTESGVPRLSAEVVEPFRVAAQLFVDQRGT